MKTCFMLLCTLIAWVGYSVSLPLADDEARPKAEAILAKMSLDEKVSLLGGVATMYLKAFPALGIAREWAMSDCSHAMKPEHRRDAWGYVQGVDDRSVALPPLSSLAMTWNRELASAHGHVMGEQMRARGKDQMLGPGVNIARTPLCGRNWEYMGEDPYLTSQLVVPLIRAVQSHGVAATVKHFCLNNQERNRFATDAVVDERTFHEIYLPAFRAAVVDAGVLAVMTSYNHVNGTFASENAYLQRGILREQFGFKGMIVTDWGGAHSTVSAALNGGNVEMNFGKGIVYFTDHYNNKLPLAESVRRGDVPEATVNDMALRVLYAMAKTGFLDGVQDRGARLIERHRQVCRDIGAEAVALLKNDAGTLPLDKKTVRRVVVLGMQSDIKVCAKGSSCEAHAEYEITPFEGLKAYLGPDAEVSLYPLGAMECPAQGDYAPIPNACLQTEQPNAGEAFVVRAWEVCEWMPGQKVWHDEPKVVGWATEPCGQKAAALRYRVRLRATETGPHRFSLSQGAQVSSASLFVNGAVAFKSSAYSAEVLREVVMLEKDKDCEVMVDVADCSGTNAFAIGWQTPSMLANDQPKIDAACRAADAVIVFTGTVLGEGRARESEGDDLPNMLEPAGHDDAIARLLGMGLKNLVIVNRSGTALEMPWAENCPTLVQCGYLGQEAGRSLARVLFGEINPSARLAMSFPREYKDLGVAQKGTYDAKKSIYNERFYVGYRWFDAQDIAPLFPFGHGLSYTTFAYAPASAEACATGGWKVSVKVTNTGKTAGKEVVQLYMQPLAPTVERCVRELKGFAKTRLLEAGATETAVLFLSPRDLAYYDVFLHRWRTLAGDYELQIGSTSSDIRCTVRVTVAKDVIF